MMKKSRALSRRQSPIERYRETLRQGTGDGAEGIANLRSQETHDSNDDNSDEGEDNRVLNQTLTFFFWSEQHNSNSFLSKCFPKDRP